MSDDQLSLVPGKKKRVKAPVPIAAHLPVAQVLIDSPLPHLDRLFDYAVPEKLDGPAQPGVRVRIRFAGKLTDGWLISRSADTDHEGSLAPLANVISPEVALLPEILELTRAVAARQSGVLSDVMRNAIPNRHAGAEATQFPATPAIPEIAPHSWSDYVGGAALLRRSVDKQQPRAIVTTGGDNPAQLLAEYALTVAASGQGVILVVPDRAAIDRVLTALAQTGCPRDAVSTIAADDGPAKRYRNWLAVLRGSATIVVGTRNAIFAPVANLGAICVWDDWNDSLSDPQAPYWHARDVAVLRSAQQDTALVFIGATMSVETFALMPWLAQVSRTREQQRELSPRVRSAMDESADKINPAARGARIPSLVMQTMKSALAIGPVLVLVARTGYTPRLVCDQCRQPALCSKCNGALTETQRSSAPTCHLCGHIEAAWSCGKCKGNRVRATVIGSSRTAEELGRAFPGIAVRNSSSDHILRDVDSRPAIVVATAGAAPVAQGGYAAAILLDGNSMLSRPDLGANQETYAKWNECVSLVRSDGEVVVVADSEHPAVQALIRHDPAGFAAREYEQRKQVQLPPAVRLAVLSGAQADIDEVLEMSDFGDLVSQRGPVPGRDGQVRMLLTADKQNGLHVAEVLKSVTSARSAKRKGAQVNVRIDPPTI